jgi:hypothetical protein
VKRYEKYGRNPSWIVIRFGKCFFLHGLCNSIPQNRINYVWRRHSECRSTVCMSSRKVIVHNIRIEPVTSGQPIIGIEMCSIVKQSTARKSDQSEVAISARVANQKPGKRTNQKAGYKRKQPIDSIDTKSSFYKKQRQDSRDSHFIQHVT